MEREVILFLEDILKSIKLIEEYVGNIPKEEFTSNQKLQDSVVRRLEIIGEAVKNIPDSFRKKYPEIEWKEIAGTRDRIIHAYFIVDLNIVWEIIKKDLPKFKKEIKKIISEIEALGRKQNVKSF